MPVVVDNLEGLAAEAAATIDPVAMVHVEHARWVEVAVPLLDGGVCANCHAAVVEPAWSWLDPSGDVRGYYQRGRCTACGQEGTGWIQSGERDMRDLSPGQVLSVVAAAVETTCRLRDRRIAAARHRTESKLTEIITAAILLVRAADMPDTQRDPSRIEQLLSTTRTPLETNGGHGLSLVDSGNGWEFSATAADAYCPDGILTVNESDIDWPEDCEEGTGEPDPSAQDNAQGFRSRS